MATIYELIQAERKRQDEKWGGPEHDDTHTAREWCELIHEPLAAASSAAHDYDKTYTPSCREQYVKQMVRIAALAVAAIESADRNGGVVRERLPVESVDSLRRQGEAFIKIADALEPLKDDATRMRVVKAAAILHDIEL